jgi:hypothetical protein
MCEFGLDRQGSGLTVSEAREAIALYDVRQAAPVAADPLDALEADFLAAESSGRLAQAVRQTVQSNRRQVMKAARVMPPECCRVSVAA